VTTQFHAAVSIPGSEALALELEAIACKVIDNNKKKKKNKEKNPLIYRQEKAGICIYAPYSLSRQRDYPG